MGKAEFSRFVRNKRIRSTGEASCDESIDQREEKPIANDPCRGASGAKNLSA